MAKRRKTSRQDVSSQARRQDPASGDRHRRELPWAWLVFALALAMRLLFWQATPDAEWSHSAFYKGDAPIWLDYARAIHDDAPYELGLPLRPPGNAYLVATVWNGEAEGLAAVKFLWCLLGAATASLFFAAVRRGFGLVAGCVMGFGLAISHGWMVLSTSINNETPYLFLVACAFYAWPSILSKPTVWRLLLWGGVHALACLLRVEHGLFFGLLMLWLVWQWSNPGDATWARWGHGLRRGLGYSVQVMAAFVLVLVPWHLDAWDACRRFNDQEPEVNPATEQFYRQVEQALVGMSWQEDALEAKRALPAASRRAMGNFVAATVFVRGGREVKGEDFVILEEAFGTQPGHLSEHPLIALYGGLNFYLANNAHGVEGFSRGPLNDAPPLTGGAQRYPAPLVGGLPPPNLALTYPPHLDIVNRGYAKGLAWITANPKDFTAHAWRKMRIFWDGATLGAGGYNLPFGTSGLRRRVDLVVPYRTMAVTLWQLAWLAVLMLGCRRLGRRTADGLLWQALFPWGAWLLTKVVVTLAFFGYARQGVSVTPVLLLLLVVLAKDTIQTLGSPQRRRLVGLAFIGILLLLEGGRFLRPPTLVLGGREVTATDPWPLHHHENRILEAKAE